MAKFPLDNVVPRFCYTSNISSCQADFNYFNPIKHYGSGCLLYSHLVELGIHPEQKKNIEYAIVTKDAHDEKLSGAHDYADVKKY